MKKYQIDSPEKLREALPLMKDEKGAKSAGAIATVWSVATRQKRAYRFDVYIRLGRSASLVRAHQGGEIVLGEMKLKEARAFAAGLKEREGGKPAGLTSEERIENSPSVPEARSVTGEERRRTE